MNATRIRRRGAISNRLSESFRDKRIMRSRRRSRRNRTYEAGPPSIHSSVSMASIIYIDTTYSPKLESIIDLTKSDSDFVFQPKCKVSKSITPRINRRHSMKDVSNSPIMAIQPIKRLSSTSSTNFGLVPPNERYQIGWPGSRSLSHLDSNSSTIQLKRVYPFTSVTNLLPHHRFWGYKTQQNDLMIDKIVEEMDLDLNSMDIDNNALYSLDIDSFIELYKVSCINSYHSNGDDDKL